MKKNLDIFAKNLSRARQARRLTRIKDLAERCNYSHSNISKLANGKRDPRLTSIISLCKALKVRPDELLEGLYDPNSPPIDDSYPLKVDKSVDYIVSIATESRVTNWAIHDMASKETEFGTLQTEIYSELEPRRFIEQTKVVLKNRILAKYNLPNLRKTYACLSLPLISRRHQLNTINELAKDSFYKLHLVDEGNTSYRAFNSGNNIINITINEGDQIDWSLDGGKIIAGIHGFGFPTSDVAGTDWLGCAALGHAINNGSFSKGNNLTSLTKSILSKFDGDVELLGDAIWENPKEMYRWATNILFAKLASKEIASYEILQRSVNLLMEDIKSIDEYTNTKMPIYIIGEYADIYRNEMPADRLLEKAPNETNAMLEYLLQFAQETIAREAASRQDRD